MEKMLAQVEEVSDHDDKYLKVRSCAPRCRFYSSNDCNDYLSITQASSNMTLSERRRSRGKNDLRYDPTGDMDECSSTVHIAQISYNEAIHVADTQIKRLNQTIKKIDELSDRAERVSSSSRAIEQKYQTLKAIV